MVLHIKENKLRAYVKDLRSVAVAFSGGVDSTLLLKVALDELGRDNVLAVIGRSQTYPEREFTSAENLAKQLGADYLVVDTDELANDDFSQNPPNRCFYCKTELFAKLTEIAGQKGLKYVVDGNNAGDAGDFRPGRKAAQNFGVLSPLQECGLNKEEVRMLAKKEGLTNWNKPSLACLASRFPYGQGINSDKLSTVDKAEEFLLGLGINQVRVRFDKNTARIEVLPQEFNLIIMNSKDITDYFKKLGFVYIALDLEGYRTGSLNTVLPDLKEVTRV